MIALAACKLHDKGHADWRFPLTPVHTLTSHVPVRFAAPDFPSVSLELVNCILWNKAEGVSAIGTNPRLVNLPASWLSQE